MAYGSVVWAVVATALLSQTGCAVFRMPDQLALTQSDIDDLQRRQAEMAAQVDSVRALQAEQHQLLREIRADESAQYAEVGRRLEALEQLLKHSSEEFQRRARALEKLRMEGALGATRADTTARPAVESEKLYDNAYSNLVQGRYPLAIMEFRSYLTQFPDGDLADNSQYWIGECYYAQSDLETAAQAFLAVVERYPKSDKVPAALLKTGFCYADLGQETRARTFLNRVVEEHPYSDEAIQARDRLRRLKGGARG